MFRVMLKILVILVVAKMLVKVVVLVRVALALVLEASRAEEAEVGSLLRSLVLLYSLTL